MIGWLILAHAMAAQPQSTPSQQSAPATRDGEDPNRIICRRPQAVLGSRIQTRRVCKTATEWRIHTQAMGQLQRDIQNGQDPMQTDQ